MYFVYYFYLVFAMVFLFCFPLGGVCMYTYFGCGAYFLFSRLIFLHTQRLNVPFDVIPKRFVPTTHYKIYFYRKAKYTFSLSSSASSHRCRCSRSRRRRHRRRHRRRRTEVLVNIQKIPQKMANSIT